MAISLAFSQAAAANNPLSGTFPLGVEGVDWQPSNLAIFWWYGRASTKTWTNASGGRLTVRHEDIGGANGVLTIASRLLVTGDLEADMAWTSPTVTNATCCWGTAIFAGVDAATPIEADATPSLFTNLQSPDPPAVTVATANACVITIFGKNNDYAGTVTPPALYTAAGVIEETAGTDASGGLAYRLNLPTGAENPGAWTLGGASTDDGVVYTAALRRGVGPALVARADTVVITENRSAALTRGTPTAESVTITEGLTTARPVTLLETVRLAEVWAVQRPVPGFGDSPYGEYGFGEGDARLVPLVVTEPLALAERLEAELVTVGGPILVNVGDPVALVEQARRTPRRMFIETPVLSELSSRRLGTVRLEAPILTEAQAKRPAKALAEAPGLTEASSRRATTARTETVALSETRTAIRSRVSAPADSLLLTELQAKRLTTPRADTLALTELLTTKKIVVRTVTETPVLTEIQARQIAKPITELVTLTETRATQVSRSLPEPVALIEVLAALKIVRTARADTVTLTEAHRRQPGRSLAETPIVTEVQRRRPATAIAEVVALTEARPTVLSRTRTDTVALSETLVALKILRVVRTDTVVLTEARVLRVGRALADLAALTETAAPAIARRLAEPVLLTENLEAVKTVGGPILVSVADTAVLTDSLQARRTRGVAVADTLALTEAPRRHVAQGLADAVTLLEERRAQLATRRAELVSLTESLARARVVARQVADAVTLTETLTREFLARVYQVPLAETLVVAEGLRRDLRLARLELLSLPEDLRVAVALLRAEVVLLNETWFAGPYIPSTAEEGPVPVRLRAGAMDPVFRAKPEVIVLQTRGTPIRLRAPRQPVRLRGEPTDLALKGEHHDRNGLYRRRPLATVAGDSGKP